MLTVDPPYPAGWWIEVTTSEGIVELQGERVLVVGGTGKVGGAVIRALLPEGARVRALVRTEERGRSLPEEVERVVGDLSRRADILRALEGCRVLVFITPHHPEEERLGKNALSAAEEAGVRRVVLASGAAVGLEGRAGRWFGRQLLRLFAPHYLPKHAVTDAVFKARVPFTIFEPSNFYQNDELYRRAILEDGIYPQPIGEKGVNRVDVRDISAAIVRALRDESTANRAYRVLGENLSGPESAAVWTEVLGRPIRYGGNDLRRWHSYVAGAISPAALRDSVCTYRFLQAHRLRARSAALRRSEALLGRPPIAYRAYVRELARRWGALPEGRS